MSSVTGSVPANPHIETWVKSVAAMCQPDNVFWCDGSEEEKELLTKIAVQSGDLLPLNQKAAPGCYLHRSALNDVARTENLTFVCTEQQEVLSQLKLPNKGASLTSILDSAGALVALVQWTEDLAGGRWRLYRVFH